MSRTLLVAVILVGVSSVSSAAVLCARPKKDGTFSTSVKIRQVCKPNEVQLAPEAVGFCCTTTTVTTTTLFDPDSTTTTETPTTVPTTTMPVPPDCGNGVLDAGEDCESSFGAQCCDEQCRFRGFGSPCGNAPSSQCDDYDSCNGDNEVCVNRFKPPSTECFPGASPETVCRTYYCVPGQYLCHTFNPSVPKPAGTPCNGGDGMCDGAGACATLSTTTLLMPTSTTTTLPM